MFFIKTSFIVATRRSEKLFNEIIVGLWISSNFLFTCNIKTHKTGDWPESVSCCLLLISLLVWSKQGWALETPNLKVQSQQIKPGISILGDWHPILNHRKTPLIRHGTYNKLWGTQARKREGSHGAWLQWRIHFIRQFDNCSRQNSELTTQDFLS